MINFRDIPTQKEPSYVFISSPSQFKIRWELERNGIAYTMIPRPKAALLPEGIKFPETVPIVYGTYPEYDCPTDKVTCIVSHLNKEAFIKRLREMDSIIDEEYEELEEQRKRAYEQTDEYKFHIREAGLEV